MLRAYQPGPVARHRERGISLVVVLILLVAVSVLGIAVLRSSAMQERMSANLRDRNLAVQTTEATLRFAQERLAAGAWDTALPDATSCNNLSICPTGSAPRWRAMPAGSYDAQIPDPPEYWIEYLGQGPARKGSCDQLPPTLDCFSPMYRVTARTRSVGRADVVMQANIISRIPEPGT
ncbi:PilX N-terminal domain-containing pilus assembly protein [Luteimonas sp. M1R5S18]|jgi:type IV pilus assembly protein PilX|uniref:PilX N-terminal domain-containing pilus assembly protein n=1 Tax=Luteimonas rhizosphaericola TaxID=3042024 RepID=A0ABT6JMM0_9GAMM|nr:PilX N-terminal domain-containing pilus assembly protein [Luteimonas rhizosphaericola]MDH5831933.1 PilX N-terminal domain-containing pilus assembly protein [Luteimonas rhizosphaericola]